MSIIDFFGSQSSGTWTINSNFSECICINHSIDVLVKFGREGSVESLEIPVCQKLQSIVLLKTLANALELLFELLSVVKSVNCETFDGLGLLSDCPNRSLWSVSWNLANGVEQDLL